MVLIMSRQFTRDFFFEVSAGRIAGHSSEGLAGLSTLLPINAENTLWNGGVPFKTLLTAVDTMDITSTSAQDGVAGTGALTLLVDGLDVNFDPQFEIITMNGLTAVTTVNSYIRLQGMIVISSGSSRFNVGNISANTTTAPNSTQSFLIAGESLARDGAFTVPSGKVLLINNQEVNGAELVGSSPKIEYRLRIIPPVGNTLITVTDRIMKTDVQNSLFIPQPVTFPIGEKRDLFLTGMSDTNNGEMRARALGVLVDEDLVPI